MAQIDVLMPARNASATIGSAIESILRQTFKDLRLFVIDDRSTDDTVPIAGRFAARDKRVTLAENPGGGIVDALNYGLQLSSAPFVARMDCDDVSCEVRLERQLAAMVQRPRLAALGTGFRCIGSRMGTPLVVSTPQNCRTAMCLFTPLCHPTVMMRRSALARLARTYCNRFPYAEDYELFSRLVAVGELDNLPDVLLDYRVHPGQVSQHKRLDQRRSAFRIATRYITETFGIDSKSTARVMALMARKALALGPGHARSSARALRNALLVAHEGRP